MATAPYYVPSGFPILPPMASASQHSFHSLLGDDMMPGYTSEQNPSLLHPAVAGHHAVSGHQRSSSVRSQTPETSIATSGQMADTLVTPAPLSHRIDTTAQVQQKELLMDDGSQDGQMGMPNGNSPWSGDSPGDSGILTGVGPNSGCGSNMATASKPLPRAVRNAIPAYIDIYWERFHAFYPVVHRPTFEAEGEDVLRCAMAAIATQYINGKEDGLRGSQLHDFAWQETKRVSRFCPLCLALGSLATCNV